jgi:hypothetical protein
MAHTILNVHSAVCLVLHPDVTSLIFVTYQRQRVCVVGLILLRFMETRISRYVFSVNRLVKIG